MMVLCLSVFFIGLIHSLSPGHWFPIVILSKSNRWSLKQTLAAAALAASGHVVFSAFLGLGSYFLEKQMLTHWGLWEMFELASHIFLIVFGIIYASQAYRRHASCHGHTHHGPAAPQQKDPLKLAKFLFLLGAAPCLAVLPVFMSCAHLPLGWFSVCMGSFAAGVFLAFFLATGFGHFSLAKLDKPIFEHYADVLTGLALSLAGMILLICHLAGLH